MSNKYHIVEPHPSTRSKSFMHTSRGGAGNIVETPLNVTRGFDASGPAARHPSLSSWSISSKSQHDRKYPFPSGRGGVGNMHRCPSERAIFSFDEELEQQLRRDARAAPIYHVGRGGAGNVSYATPTDREIVYLDGGVRTLARKDSETESASSKSSRDSQIGADVATRKLKEFAKAVGVGRHRTT